MAKIPMANRRLPVGHNVLLCALSVSVFSVSLWCTRFFLTTSTCFQPETR